MLVANRKGERRIDQRDVSKREGHILVLYCAWEVAMGGGSSMLPKPRARENENEGKGEGKRRQ